MCSEPEGRGRSNAEFEKTQNVNKNFRQEVKV